MAVSSKKKITKYVLVLCAGIFAYGNVNAQSWQLVGNAGFSGTSANELAFVADHNGIPYVAYKDAEDSSLITVMKYDNGNWVSVGHPGMGNNRPQSISLAINGNNTPYVAFSDANNFGKLTVVKYDGSNWVSLGNTGLYSNAQYLSMVIDDSDQPYIAYENFDEANMAIVEKYNGVNWITWGGLGGIGTISSDGTAYTSLATNANGNMAVAYSDAIVNGEISVNNYNGSYWPYMGGEGISDSVAEYVSLAIDENGVPYVAYTDWGNAYKETVIKYTGNSWITVGNAGFSTDSTAYSSLAIGENNVPFVAYQDNYNNKKASVMAYNGNNWTVVGNAGFSDSVADNTILSVAGGVLYVAYTDYGHSGKATVMKYVYTTSVSNINQLDVNISPNPAKSEVTISYTVQNSDNTSLSITNLTGQTIISQNLGRKQSGKVTLPIQQLPSGVYLMQLKSGNEVTTQKFVKE